eukprot:3706443-Alexandrium_andersonii.AAC.1
MEATEAGRCCILFGDFNVDMDSDRWSAPFAALGLSQVCVGRASKAGVLSKRPVSALWVSASPASALGASG